MPMRAPAKMDTETSELTTAEFIVFVVLFLSQSLNTVNRPGSILESKRPHSADALYISQPMMRLAAEIGNSA